MVAASCASSLDVFFEVTLQAVTTRGLAIYICIYIYRERERERDRQTDRQTEIIPRIFPVVVFYIITCPDFPSFPVPRKNEHLSANFRDCGVTN